MLYLVAAVLIFLWLFEFITAYTAGGLLAVLGAAVGVILLLRAIGRRRAA